MPDYGSIFDEIHEKLLRLMVSMAPDGDRGPSIQKKAAEKHGAVLVDELIGKIGPIVDVYESEATNRIAGEWE